MESQKYQDFGYTVFGPFLYGFTKWLRERIVANGDTKIFFFSRDGYIMQKAYLLFEEAQTLGLEHSYAYFSRNSLRRGLLWECHSYEESLRYLSKERFNTVAEIASYYGLQHEELSPLLAEIGIGWNDNVLQANLEKNEKIKCIYTRFSERIRQRSHEQFELTVAYLKQIGMNGRCAIVDIGWNGTMQYYLDKLIDISEIDADINGYYVGINPSKPHKGKCEGYVFNQENLTLRKSITCFLGGVEKLFQSLEGSADGYVRCGEKISPVLKAYEYKDDKQIINYITNLQQGSLDYVENVLAQKDMAKEGESAYDALIKFGKTPSYNDTQMFRFFYITDGEKQYFIPQKPLYKYKPKEFVFDLSNSIWKTGFMKAAFRVPFPYYWVYNLMRK
ncbi:MAG: hypothetical protein IJ190_03265 [Prevotella sp.]|nr:hypothetical protein [Prevotella sp.]